jgi:hypothetical protein
MTAVSEKTPEMAMRYSVLHSNMKRLAEMTNPPRDRSTSNRKGMLRHTAGASFYQGRLELALNKSSLIEVDICIADNTAQAKAA